MVQGSLRMWMTPPEPSAILHMAVLVFDLPWRFGKAGEEVLSRNFTIQVVHLSQFLAIEFASRRRAAHCVAGASRCRVSSFASSDFE